MDTNKHEFFQQWFGHYREVRDREARSPARERARAPQKFEFAVIGVDSWLE